MIAGLLLAASFVSVIIGFRQSIAAVQLQRVHHNIGWTFQAQAPGTWMLWKGVQGSGGDTAAADVVEQDKPSVTAPDGRVLPAEPTIRQIRFSRPDDVADLARPGLQPLPRREWYTVGRFEIDQPGIWAVTPTPGAWAVSPDPLGAVKWWALGSVSLSLVLVGAAACTGWIGLKERRAEQMMHSMQG